MEMLTRRDAVGGALRIMFAASALSMCRTEAGAVGDHGAIRAVNIMNFIRAEEPRERTDLMDPVRRQMALIKELKLPAT